MKHYLSAFAFLWMTPINATTLSDSDHVLLYDSFEYRVMPPELRLSDAKQTSLSIVWDAVTDAKFYRIYYATKDFSSLSNTKTAKLRQFAADNGGNYYHLYSEYLTLDNLEPATNYFFLATSVDADNEVSAPRLSEFNTNFPSIRFIKGQSLGMGSVDIRWQALPAATAYTVYFSPKPFIFEDSKNKTAKQLAEQTQQSGGTVYANLTETHLTINNLNTSQTYYFAVIASNQSIKGYVNTGHSVTVRGAMNDTGVTISEHYATGVSSDCQVNVKGGQDCQYGRDNTHNDDADGVAGFSFAKLDSAGNVLAADATHWSCVKDLTTGLIWEVKDSTYSASRTYPYYDSRYAGDNDLNDNRTDGGDDGIWGGVDTSNDTQSYAVQLNRQARCGLTNWRLPSKAELRSIVNYGSTTLDVKGNLVMIDTNYFPYTTANDYWTSTHTIDDPESAWTIFFGNGLDGSRKKDSSRRVKLVSGNQ